MRAVVLLLLAFPGSAWAGDVTLRARDVPIGRVVPAPIRFDTVGLHWRGSGSVSFRVRAPDGRWSGWRPAAPEAEDLPDREAPENRRAGWKLGNPWHVGESDGIRIRTRGRVTRVRAFFLRSPEVRVPLRQLSIANSPKIVPRASWRANESLRRAAPRYADALRFAVVHHTAGGSGSTPAQAAAIVRSIAQYHVRGNGWDDIGYNFLVDRWGNVYEGRFGGVDRPVIGAHAEGFNTGSVGVALIGTYTSAGPTAAQRDALERLLAWRLDLVHVDPAALLTVRSGGNARFPAGTTVALRGVIGHRDTGPTSCPGNALYALLASIRADVTATGAPKLYAPRVTGTLGSSIRFAGRLSHALPWTVTVRDTQARVVAAGAGTGTAVDWTWDSRGAIPGTSYSWVIAAGVDVRPASGVLGSRAAALTLTQVTATPPRIDGTVATSTTIAYTLSAPANVTAELVNAGGTPVATLFTEDKPAGRHTFAFTGQGVPDGTYTIRLTARDVQGRQVQASVRVLVSRALLGFGADAYVVSPNGDGRRDSATFSVSLASSADVTLALVAGRRSTPIFRAALPPGSHVLPWTGVALDGSRVPDGRYRATLTIGTPPLAVAQSVPMTVDTRAPTLRLVSLAPPRLKVNERASIIGKLNGRRLSKSVRPGVFRLLGRTVRTLALVARDAAGNDSARVTWPR